MDPYGGSSVSEFPTHFPLKSVRTRSRFGPHARTTHAEIGPFTQQLGFIAEVFACNFLVP